MDGSADGSVGASSSQIGQAKVRRCSVCRQDCSGRPRVKDARGRYLCEHAFTTMKQARTQGVEITHERMWCADTKREKRDTARRGAELAAAAPIGLADDDGGPDLTSLAELEASSGPAIGESQTGSSCPKCGGFMAVSAVICTSCGFNAATGKAAKTMTGKEADKDEKKSKRRKLRPEEMNDRELRAYEDSRDAARKAYMTPIITFLVVSGLSMLAYGVWGGDLAPLLILKYGIQLVIETPLLGVIYLFACLTFAGMDAPFRLMVLQLIAVVSVGLIPTVINDLVAIHTGGLGIFGWMMPIVFYGVAVQVLMDHDQEDGFIIAALLVFAKLIVFFVIIENARSLIASAGGGGATGTWQDTPGYIVGEDGDAYDDYTYLSQSDYQTWWDGTYDEESPFDNMISNPGLFEEPTEDGAETDFEEDSEAEVDTP